jgi:hypothetical protein
MKNSFRIFSNQATTVKPQPSSSPIPISETKPTSSSIPVKSNPGENHDDLEHIEVKFDKNLGEQSTTTTQKSSINNKHSPNNNNNNPNKTANSGFSLKNPVSSFRSWVSNKKSSKEDTTPMEQSSSTTYKKIDTSPTPRKSSFESDSTKRNRTNSASITTTTNSNHQDIQINASSLINSARVKKKSSFSLRSNNPISLLKRTSETTNNTNETESTEQTGTGTGGGGGAGPFGYLKNLVRSEKQ